MRNKEPIILLSVSDFSKTVHHSISNDEECPYTIVAFIQTDVNKERMDNFCDCPVVMYSEMIEKYPPAQYRALVGIGYVKMNTVRRQYISEMEEYGYTLVNYISSNSIVDSSAVFEHNVIVFEGNIIQCFSTLKNGVILSRGNSIGHNSTIEECTFIANRAVLCGYNQIGQECFIGSNATVLDLVSIADRTLVGAASIVKRDTQVGQVFITKGTSPIPKCDSSSFFNW